MVKSGISEKSFKTRRKRSDNKWKASSSFILAKIKSNFFLKYKKENGDNRSSQLDITFVS